MDLKPIHGYNAETKTKLLYTLRKKGSKGILINLSSFTAFLCLKSRLVKRLIHSVVTSICLLKLVTIIINAQCQCSVTEGCTTANGTVPPVGKRGNAGPEPTDKCRSLRGTDLYSSNNNTLMYYCLAKALMQNSPLLTKTFNSSK